MRGLNSIFPIPIFIDKAEGSEYTAIQEELTIARNKIKFNDTGSNMVLNDNPFENNILNDYQCNHTLNFINKNIKSYIDSLYSKSSVKWEVINAWMTKTLNGRSSREHHHGHTNISGVYYLDTNGNDGTLVFPNIHSHLAANILLEGIVEKDVTMPLGNGIIILWPGQLRHRTQVNETDHERISISFNISVRSSDIV